MALLIQTLLVRVDYKLLEALLEQTVLEMQFMAVTLAHLSKEKAIFSFLHNYQQLLFLITAVVQL